MGLIAKISSQTNFPDAKTGLLLFKFEILLCFEKHFLVPNNVIAISSRHLMMSEAILISLNDAKMLSDLITASKMLNKTGKI